MSISAIPGQEPQTGRYLGGVEELAGQGNHAVHESRFDQTLTDFTLTRLGRGHGSVGEHESRDSRWCQMVHDMLHPSKVGISFWRGTVLPALVLSEPFPSPILHVERRVSENEISPQVRVAGR